MGCCNCKKKKVLGVKLSTSNQILKIQPIEIPKYMSHEELDAHCKDIKNIYAYAIEAMKNYLGKPSYPYITQPKQLYPYILFLCEGLEDHEYVTIKESISERQLLNIQLTVIVREAKVIHPKITEFSQIFCKLRISNGAELFTSVRDISSNLLWDETFIFDIQDYESDSFHIEFWSSRPGFFERGPTIGLDSFKEEDPLAEEKGIYFVGDAVEYVKSLPCKGEDMTWSIKKGPRRVHTKGQVKIYMQLGTKKSKDFIVHLYCHMALLRMCFEKQVVMLTEEKSSRLWKNWLEILPNAALTLMEQHALQHGIAPVEQCLCSWLVASSLKMRHEDRISFYFLRDILSFLLATVDEESLGQMKEVLSKNIADFSSYTRDMLRDLHKNFDVQKKLMADELYYMLRCINTTELKICESYIECFENVQEEASDWYLQVIADLKKDLQDEESVEKICEGLKEIMKIYLKNQILLDDIFQRAWDISYSSVTYKRLDHVVCTTIRPMIEHLLVILEDPERKRKTVESLKMLQLYHCVRNLVNYMLNCIPSQRIVLRMGDYSSWFGEEMALEWFLLCDIYTAPFIKRALLLENMERIDSGIFHGTSAPDVMSIIDEMVVDIWMKMKWKDQFFTHGALLEAVKSCVSEYNRNIFERIEVENFFCRVDEFSMNEKLCVALSNVYGIFEHLNKTKEKIKRELRTSEVALGFTISEPLIYLQSEMHLMAANGFFIVFKKIEKKIERLVKISVKSRADKQNCGRINLSTFVDNILEMMYLNLKTEAFYVVLKHMWIIMLACLKKGLKLSESCFVFRKEKLNIAVTTLHLLNQMRAIFFCDGHGLTQYEMDNIMHEDLKCSIETKLQKK